MTQSEFEKHLLSICSEMALWPVENKKTSVYIRRSEAGDKATDWARRIAKLIDSNRKGEK